MKALFITTGTPDCRNHVRAWDSLGEPCRHVTFDHQGINNDWQLVAAAEQMRPEMAFYIGACPSRDMPGLPGLDAFRQIRAIAPLVNVVSDAGDAPWHRAMDKYRENGCFDLQVSIDGAIHSPADLATLTPVDASAWDGAASRDIRCGFSGNPGRHSERGYIVRSVEEFGGLTIRRGGGSYEDHVAFVKRCRLLLNVSLTGSQKAHHVKGRVVEAGWAGCALLEHADSPIGAWFPEGAWFPYRNAREAAALIHDLTDDEIAKSAALLHDTVQAKYTARQIYGLMIEGARRTVRAA